MDSIAAPTDLGLYIHIPFCEKKCPYCDFNTYAGLTPLFGSTVDALVREMARWRTTLLDCRFDTVFLGGGTPTVLDGADLERLFRAIHDNFNIDAAAEITSEANPGTVDQAKFAELRRLGVNRLSLGVQSFQPAELDFLGRIHDVDDVYAAVAAARRIGFDNINLDFMFGLPHQSPSLWRDTLRQAIELEPEHLSLYSLIVEPQTPLHLWVQSGFVEAPNEDDAATLYEIAMAMLADAGYCHYEVSNWARLGDTATHDRGSPTLACRHNLIYWRNQEYLGVGPGAHSHLHLRDGGRLVNRRWSNHKAVQGYVRRIMQDNGIEMFHEELTPEISMGETMMLGLRLLREGVTFARFEELHHRSLLTVFGPVLERLVELNLLELDADGARLSRQGAMLGNQVFLEFLAESEG